MLDLNVPIVVSGEMKSNLIAELNTLAEWVDDPALGASSANRVICYMSVLMDELEKAYCSALFVTQMAARLEMLLSLIAKFHDVRKPPEMPVFRLFSEAGIKGIERQANNQSTQARQVVMGNTGDETDVPFETWAKETLRELSGEPAPELASVEDLDRLDSDLV
jgi:hypothetical protein